MYGAYVCNHGDAIEVFDRVMEHKPRFKAFVEVARTDPKLKGLDVKDILIMPVQVD